MGALTLHGNTIVFAAGHKQELLIGSHTSDTTAYRKSNSLSAANEKLKRNEYLDEAPCKRPVICVIIVITISLKPSLRFFICGRSKISLTMILGTKCAGS